jgi:hypothetical protein
LGRKVLKKTPRNERLIFETKRIYLFDQFI